MWPMYSRVSGICLKSCSMVLQEVCAPVNGSSGSGGPQPSDLRCHQSPMTPRKQRHATVPASPLSAKKSIAKSMTPKRSPSRAQLTQQVPSDAEELPYGSSVTDQAPACISMQHGPVPDQQQTLPAPQEDALEVSALPTVMFHNHFAVLTCPAGFCDLATS